MAANSAGYVAYVREQLAGVAEFSSGRFFGGTGLSTDGVQFAMIMADTLYFAVDERSRPRYEAAGCDCFRYSTRKGPVRVRRYFEVPGAVLDDRDSLHDWARDAIAAARNGRGVQ